MSEPVVIVGAGHAGTQLAASLREEDYSGPVLLCCDEPHAPYQRPPLSKAYLKGAAGRDALALRGAAFFSANDIGTRLDDKAVAIDRANRVVRFASGHAQPYSHLVLATGSRARPAPFPGVDLAGVLTLRNLDDADALKRELEGARSVAVIGAGFIGLEFAATACAAGKRVTVVEAAPRVMGRAVSPLVSHHFADAHRAFGATLLTRTLVAAIEGEGGRAARVRLAEGAPIPADLVLLGIGVLAEDALARDAGLRCADGIAVDDRLLTSDPHISAIGDCAHHPNGWAGGPIRLESVQNAHDQARVAARRLAGKPASYAALPWFWSDQGDLKLQIAGLIRDADTFVVRGEPASRSYSVFAYAGSTLRAVESVNRGGDHMAARRILNEKLVLTPDEAADPRFDLKAFAMGRMPVRATA